MNTSTNRFTSKLPFACTSLAVPFAMAMTLAITGCSKPGQDTQQATLPAMCGSPCDVPIELPQDGTRLPEVPDLVVVSGDATVNFKLPQGNGSRGERTVLSFEKPLFVNRSGGNLLYTLELEAGDNQFKTRGVVAGECDALPGCRYVVINVGRGDRPSIISSPRFIIR